MVIVIPTFQFDLMNKPSYIHCISNVQHALCAETKVRDIMLSQSKIDHISQTLNNLTGLVCAYLHGSAVTSRFTPESDVDIALLLAPGYKKDYYALVTSYCGLIESGIHQTPHFSFLSSRNVVFAKQVVTRGKLILCKDSFACKSFTMHILSMYHQLNQERKKIIEQYVA